MIPISIGPQSFSRDFLNGQGQFNFDLPAGLKPTDTFTNTVTEVLNTGASVDKSVLTFGDPNGLAMSASISGGGSTKVELSWPDHPSDFVQAYGISVPAGRVGARVHLEGQAGGNFAGGVPIPAALANFEFGLKTGSHVSYDRFALYDDQITAGALLQDLVTSLALPQRTGSTASLPKPGEVLVFGYGGFLELSAGLTCGYELMGHQGLTLNDLNTVIEYGVRLKAGVNVGFTFGGDFEISSRLGSTPGWVRLVVKKARTSSASFAASFQAQAIAAITGLPDSADEFLASLLGADVRRALEIFQKIRADSDLDTLQADVDKLLLTPVTSLANRWIGRALDGSNVKQFQASVGKVVDAYQGADARLVTAVVHLYEDYLTDNAVGTLTAALTKIVSLGRRADLATLTDAEAWRIIYRLTGGSLAALIQDDRGFEAVKSTAQTALDFVQGRFQPGLRDVVDELHAKVDVNDLFKRLGPFATRERLLSLTDMALQGVAERLLGMAWDKIKTSDVAKVAADLKAALDRVEDFKNAWYTKLSGALQQSFAISANLAFTRTASDQALVDVEIDVSSAAGQQLFALAAHGQFRSLFDRQNMPLFRVNAGTLTHQLTKSTQLLVNILQWEQKRLVDVLSSTTNSIEVQATGLVNVFTTDASIKTRIEKRGYQLESTFLIDLAGSAERPSVTTPGGIDQSDFLIESLDKIGVSYDLAVSDNVTTVAELTQYLDLAEFLRLIPSAASYAATLAAQFPTGLGQVSATYVAKYDSTAVMGAFGGLSGDPLRDVVSRASRYLISAHLINSSNPLSELVVLGFAYRDPATAAAYARDGFASFNSNNSSVTVPAWFTRGTPRTVTLPSGSAQRQILSRLYRLESDLADGLAKLDATVDTARSKHAPVNEPDLEAAARGFVASGADIDKFGTINTFFGVFDAFVQQGNGGRVRPASTLILQITPAGSQTPVTKYLMS